MNKKRFVDSIMEPITASTDPTAWKTHLAEDLANRQDYAMKMLELQERANLTYKEATVFLHSRSAKMMHQLTDDWGITMEGIYNLLRRARTKIGKADMQITDFINTEEGFID